MDGVTNLNRDCHSERQRKPALSNVEGNPHTLESAMPPNPFSRYSRCSNKVGLRGVAALVSWSNMRIRVLRQEDTQAFSTLRLEALETDPRAFGSSPEEHRVLTTAQVADRIRPIPEGKFVTGAFDDKQPLNREHRLPPRAPNQIPPQRHDLGRLPNPSLSRQRHRQKPANSHPRSHQNLTRLLQVTLAVSAEEKSSWRLYHSAGFQEFGLELAALKIAADYVDEHWMVLRLRNHPQPPVPPPVAPGDESHEKKI